jgi:hypothetical protein
MPLVIGLVMWIIGWLIEPEERGIDGRKLK